MRIPMAMRSKVWFSTHLIISNPSEGIDVRRLCLLCVVWVPASTTGLSLVQRIPNGCMCVCVCLIVCGRETSTIRRPRSVFGCCVKKNCTNITVTQVETEERCFPPEKTE